MYKLLIFRSQNGGGPYIPYRRSTVQNAEFPQKFDEGISDYAEVIVRHGGLSSLPKL